MDSYLSHYVASIRSVVNDQVENMYLKKTMLQLNIFLKREKCKIMWKNNILVDYNLIQARLVSVNLNVNTFFPITLALVKYGITFVSLIKVNIHVSYVFPPKHTIY